MGSGSGAGDDKTRAVFRKDDNEQETRILPNRPGAAPGGQQRDQRGTLIGVADIQQQVRVAGQPAPGHVQNQGYAATPQHQGGQETVFLTPAQAAAAGTSGRFDPVVGWLVIIDGPGRGTSLPIYYGQNSIGRGSEQRVVIDFGDQRISRDSHAYVIYDDQQRKFYVRDNGKSNLVRHRGNVVMAPTEIADRDELRIGDTTLMFIALCNTSFDWLAADEQSKA
jgi:hypothetical protein